jgi:hypothetical protein
MSESGTKYLNCDSLVFAGTHRSHDNTFNIFSQGSEYITFDNNIKTTTIDTDNIKSLQGNDILSYENDTIKFNGTIDFNNQTLTNMSGMSNLTTNQIDSLNINDTLDKELDNLTISVNNNTTKLTGLTTNKLMRSNNSGTATTSTIDVGDLILNNITNDQSILGNLHLPNDKHIKYDGVQLNHTHLDGFDLVQDQIDLNTAKIGISSVQTANILTNNDKITFSPANLVDLDLNSLKIGISTSQASQIIANSNKQGISSGESALILQNESDITDLDTNKVNKSNPTYTGLSNGICRIDSNVLSGNYILLSSDIPQIPISKISDFTAIQTSIDANTAKISFSSANLSELQTATSTNTSQASTISTHTTDISNLDTNKVSKATPTFSGLVDGICRIDSNVLSSNYSLVSDDIPSIPSTKINTTLSESQIPNLQGSKIVSVIDSSIVPNLPASKITSGTIPLTRLVSTVVNTDSNQTCTGVKSFSNGCLGGSFSGNYSALNNNGSLSLKNTTGFSSIDFNFDSTGLQLKDNSQGDIEVVGGNLNVESGLIYIASSQMSSANLSNDSNLAKLSTLSSSDLSNDSNLAKLSTLSSSDLSNDSNLAKLSTLSSANLSNDSNLAKLDALSTSSLSDGATLVFDNDLAPANLINYTSIVNTFGNQNIVGNKYFQNDINVQGTGGNNSTKLRTTGNISLINDGTNSAHIYMLSDDFSTQLTCDKPNACLSINKDVSLPSGFNYQINNQDISTSNLSNSSNIVLRDSSQIISGSKTFNSNITILDTGNVNNQSILQKIGKLYMRTTDTGASSSLQMISNNHSCLLSADESTSTLLIDKDVNIPTGKEYKINNVALASTDLSDTSNIAKLNQTGMNFTQTVQFSGNSIGVVSNAFNNSIINNDGRIELDNNTSSANIRLTSTAHVVNISSDTTNSCLKIDNDININSGKKYKIDNIALASTDLLDYSQLMLKPTIWLMSGANSVKIQSTRNVDSELFIRSDTWYNTTTNVYEEIPDYDGDYSVYIQGETVSSQFGIYFFTATFNFIIRATTNDGDATPQIVLPLNVFHHASTHGAATITLQPIASNNWKVYLTWDSVGVDDTNDILEYTMKLRKNYWG